MGDVVKNVKSIIGQVYDELEAVEQAGVADDGEAGMGMFVGALLANSARETARNFEMLYEGEQRAHEETKRRLEAALDQIATARWRASWLVGDVDTPEPEVWQ